MSSIYFNILLYILQLSSIRYFCGRERGLGGDVHVCPCVPMCAHVCPCVPMCVHVCPCVSMCAHVYDVALCGNTVKNVARGASWLPLVCKTIEAQIR